MRISTQMIQRFAVGSILDRQTGLSKTQQQLATGRRILTPSDDPSGTTQALGLKQQMAQTDQYSSNIGRLKSSLEAEESVLVAVGDAMMRVRELGVQGFNNSYGQQDRKSIAAEVWLLKDELFNLANSKDGTGEYMFSGFHSATQPFVDNGGGSYSYQGDQGQRRIKISPTREVAASDSGSDIFENLSIAAGGKRNIFETIDNFATSLEANSPDPDILTDLDTALASILNVRAQVGARMNAIDSQQQINDQFNVQIKSTISDISDLDYAEAISRLNLELAGLQAAQQAFTKIQNLSLFNFL